MNKPPLRLVSLLIQQIKKSNPNHVLNDINRANSEVNSGCSITRPMIAGIAKGRQVAFTWNHLVAFHVYFKRRHGISFQHYPLLETRGIYEALGENQDVVFMYGAMPRPKEKRTDNSRWDTLSNGELIQQITEAKGRPQIRSMDVLWKEPANAGTALASMRNAGWYQVISQDKVSVFSIGSPLAALSSEIMLARMFNVDPFTPPDLEKSQVPFHFVWLHRFASKFQSAFGVNADALRAKYPELAGRVKKNQVTAVLIGEEPPRESPTKATNWIMYGIIAVQRRPGGHLWVVVAGLHGPATYGAAKVVKDICEEVPLPTSCVLWVPVKVCVSAGKSQRTDGDIREVVWARLDGAPKIWPDPKNTPGQAQQTATIQQAKAKP